MAKVIQLGQGPVDQMSWDCMSGTEGLRRHPSWLEIEHRIKALDTPEHSTVFLKGTNGDLLTMAGDQAHGMLVFLSTENGHEYVLAPPGNRNGRATIVIGFQPGDYAKRILVDIDTALKVARKFFQTGRREDSVEWTRDDTAVE